MSLGRRMRRIPSAREPTRRGDRCVGPAPRADGAQSALGWPLVGSDRRCVGCDQPRLPNRSRVRGIPNASQLSRSDPCRAGPRAAPPEWPPTSPIEKRVDLRAMEAAGGRFPATTRRRTLSQPAACRRLRPGSSSLSAAPRPGLSRQELRPRLPAPDDLDPVLIEKQYAAALNRPARLNSQHCVRRLHVCVEQFSGNAPTPIGFPAPDDEEADLDCRAT
jgi:hypothetical protein